MRVKSRILPAAVLILLLATFLRFHLISAQSFWNDEGNSARLSERPIPAIIEGTASDIHPPLYYLFLRGWRELLGETEFGLRSFSAFAGILSVAVVAALARQATQERRRGDEMRLGKGLVTSHSSLVTANAALLAAVSPVLVYYSQETRMYALLALLAVGSAWCLLHWLGAGKTDARPLGWAVAYIALLTAGLYTQYFFPAVIAAQGAIVGLWQLSPHWVYSPAAGENRARGRRTAAWLGMVAIAVAFYAPWIPIFLRQIGGRSGDPTSLAAFAESSSRWLVLGSTVSPGEATWAAVAAIVLIILGVAAGRRRSAAPLILSVIPLLFMYLARATDPAFFKFMLVVAPFVIVLMGLAWRLRWPWVAAPAALTIAVLAGSFVSLGNLYGEPAFARADYRGMAARIAADSHENAGILLNAPNQWEAFTYYHREGAPVYPLPRGRSDPAILLSELTRIVAAHDRLYALYWGDAQRDPDHFIERWLDANTFKASEEWVGDVRFVVYSVARASTVIPTPSGAQFAGLDGETITLSEYTVWPLSPRLEDVVQVSLAWSADETPARPYKVFLHLLDSSGVPVAQRDSEPLGGSRPTTGWNPGEVLIDKHGILLPLTLPPGEYRLQVGLYDAFDPAVRLPMANEDSLYLQTITVQN